MTATYVRVLVLEAAIIVALWLFGRAFRRSLIPSP